MDTLSLFSLALISVPQLVNILIAAAGLGMVIFFHELGHFAVAKWCDVYVERFSIGFGPPIVSWKWGETEYWLSWIPFGGYVKMLGQDDMDPGQMVDEEVAEDPRSYSAKSVPQRMAIISAGVTMNIITGYLFFTIAFSSGVETTGPGIGFVQVGMPGWKQGVQMGDTITAINGRSVATFEDILRGTALSRGPIRLQGTHENGESFDLTIQPEKTDIVRKLGLGPRESLEVADLPADKFAIRLPGTAAATVDFQAGDVVTTVDGQAVENYTELVHLFHEKADQPLAVTVKRKADGEEKKKVDVELTLPPQQFVGFGMKMWTGTVDAVRDDSPAARAGFKVGDKISSVGELEVGKDIDPYRLTEYFSAHAGEEVSVVVTRDTGEGQANKVENLTVIPEPRDAWAEPPMTEGSPLSIPSLGVAYHLLPNVWFVEEGSPAEQAGIKARDSIEKMILRRKKDGPKDNLEDDVVSIAIGDRNWAYAYWLIQENARSRDIELVVKDREEKVAITAVPVTEWFMPTDRGLLFSTESTVMKAYSLGEAFSMSANYTVTSIEDIYLTIRGLVMRDISHKGLSGPLRIAEMAYGFADLGIGHFLRFLGLISINLAVINFLPIPILDGGHMVFLIWEGVQRKKPPEKVVNAAHLFGLVLILSMMVFVFYQDIVSFIS